MKYLFIDDDARKVQDFVRYLAPEDSFRVLNNYHAAIKEIRSNLNCDVIVLDMNFPLRENEQPESMMGMGVLTELKRKEIDIPVVVFSSNKIDVSKYPNVIKTIEYDVFTSLAKDVLDVSELIKGKVKTK